MSTSVLILQAKLLEVRIVVLDPIVQRNFSITRFLTHCILVDSSAGICQMSPFVILGASGLFCHFYFRWKLLLANNLDTDQMPHYLESDLGLHCLPLTLLQVPK